MSCGVVVPCSIESMASHSAVTVYHNKVFMACTETTLYSDFLERSVWFWLLEMVNGLGIVGSLGLCCR